MRYRCFCMTRDGRIITGAFVTANDANQARAAADLLWRQVPKAHHTEVWLGRVRLLEAPNRAAMQTPFGWSPAIPDPVLATGTRTSGTKDSSASGLYQDTAVSCMRRKPAEERPSDPHRCPPVGR